MIQFSHSLKIKKYLKILFVLLFSLINLGGAFSDRLSYAKTDGEEEESIIIKYKSIASEIEKKNIRERRQLRLENKIPRLNAEVLKVKRAQKQSVLEEYRRDSKVEYAEPDYELKEMGVTNDPNLSRAWGMFKIEAAKNDGASAWDITIGESVNIAVLDTGIDENHPDLTGKIISRQNFSSSATTEDFKGHGTHVAGIIAANANNAQGVAGVAYGARLMNVKVLGDNGSGATSQVANGIIWATDNGAKVINLSLGGGNFSSIMQEAINYAWNKGVVVVAAAGNDGTTAPTYPAYYGNAIAVASTDSNDEKSGFSNYGDWVDVAAPGSNIYSTYKDGGYASLSGTSMATPHVAGLAGLVWSRGECSTNTCVRSKIEATADKIVGTGSNWSSGRINALKAVDTNPKPLACETEADTTLDGVISNSEVINYIAAWKTGVTSSSLLLKALKFWKAGIGC